MKKKIAILGTILVLGLGKLVMAQVWERIIPYGSPPEKRDGHVLVSSGGNDQFVFGGFDQNTNLWVLRYEGDTWRWENMGAKGDTPGTRGGHSGIFAREDGLTDESIIIFGGSESFLGVLVDSGTYSLGNPWDWNSAWEKLNTGGTRPSSRAEHTAVYDEWTHEMIVFGGYTGTSPIVVSTITYTLQLSVAPATWQEVPIVGEIPPPRYGHSAVWGQMWGIGQMIVFGGKDNSEELLDDCWRLEWSDWHEIDVTGDKPPARWQHTAAWIMGDPGEQGKMIIFGGEDEDGTPLDDVWILWEPAPGGPPDWRWEKIYPIGDLPCARMGHAVATGWNWEGERMVYIFGGDDGDENLNDIYVFFKGEQVEKSLERKPFNAPNPFNPDMEDTKICYYLEEDDDVKIRLFTLTGELVYSWENISGREGLNQWPWNGRNEKGKIVENGGYICLIEAGGEKQKCKIAVLR
ncbi:hypothetical protein GTN66_02255 [bacterium]|nr:hypothetical protein [bacterium]NIN92037.1 hypothetical protein [bacterium]NIO18253.1 hypothetical protein [bacterium]NIO73227.1 hypothetical protein [bacterium]